MLKFTFITKNISMMKTGISGDKKEGSRLKKQNKTRNLAKDY